LNISHVLNLRLIPKVLQAGLILNCGLIIGERFIGCIVSMPPVFHLRLAIIYRGIFLRVTFLDGEDPVELGFPERDLALLLLERQLLCHLLVLIALGHQLV
jgi:hypothetical protein